MKNAISEYLNLSNSKKETMLDTAMIVFDTNVFLNLYRRSKATREALLKIMESFKDRLWMPYQVAREFMKNRPEVIHKRISDYDNMIKAVEEKVDE